MEDVYRMYQDDRVCINAQVARASAGAQAEIQALMQRTGYVPMSAEAFFFRHIFIRCDQQHQLEVDLENKQVVGTYDTSVFDVGAPVLTHCSGAYDDDAPTRTNVSVPSRLCTTVQYSRNPQVRNGLQLTGNSMLRGTGLPVRNYRPNLFALRNTLHYSEHM